jgi:hypothetical protein
MAHDEQFSAQFPDAGDAFRRLLPFLDAHGVTHVNVRRIAYLRFLDDLQARRLDHLDARQASELMREVHEVVFVLETVVKNSLKVPTELVKAAFDGDPTQSYEPDRDRGRNYMLSMRAAIYFMRLKYDVILDEYCDVIAEDKNNRYFIECKRLYSESKVERRISEAYKQLDARLERTSDRKTQWGIAWVDPSPIILQHCRFYMAATREGARQAARYDLIQFSRRFIDRRKLPADRRIMSLVLQMVWPSCTALDSPVTSGFTSLVTPGHANMGFFEHRRAKRLWYGLFDLESSDDQAIVTR